MRLLFGAAAVLLAGGCMKAPDAAPQRPELAPPFPSLQGENLLRRDFDLPEDLDGEVNVVIVAYVRSHQADVDTWMLALDPILRMEPRLRAWEIPLISSVYRPVREYIDNGMRSGIPDVDVRERTITVYQGKSRFLRQLALRDSEIDVLLLDPDGRIRWRTAGPATEAGMDALVQAIQLLIPPQAAPPAPGDLNG